MVGPSKTIIFATVMFGCALAIPNLGDGQDSIGNISPFNNLGLPELDLQLQQEQLREKREVCCNVNGDGKEAKIPPAEGQTVLEEQRRAQRLARHLPCRNIISREHLDVMKVQTDSESTKTAAPAA